MPKNPLLQLSDYGQSIWMDFLRRSAIDSGEIAQLIREDGIVGVTSNPSIFEKAIAGSHDYDEAVKALALDGRSVADIYQTLTIEDIQRTADLFRPIYDRLEGRDGLVSLEVSPDLAHNTAGTIKEARRLWKKVDRPNLMIKIPATKEGLPAIQQLVGEGININITLLFGLPRYRQVAEAYLAGLEKLASDGRPLQRIASVASFFLSRIDTLADPLLKKIRMEGDGKAQQAAAGLIGELAIASARVAYQIYQEIFHGDRFKALALQGARPQRLLWASTSTKNPEYSDVKYVEALIGRDTINTLPIETLVAYRNHGDPHSRLEEDVEAAYEKLENVKEAGLDMDRITQQLEEEGVDKFIQAFKQLMESLQTKRQAALKEPLDRQGFQLGIYHVAVQERISRMDAEQFGTRVWQKDPGLWKMDPHEQEQIRNSLGWLHVAEKMEENLADLRDFAVQIRQEGFRHAVVLGMGGSSLTPLVFQRSFGIGKGGIPITVLDSTDPMEIQRVERKIPLKDTLFIVSSKSGTTTEPLAFFEYFYSLVEKLKGPKVGSSFVAITDPLTPLADLARERGFRRTFLNFADIGGRYSALSYFGLVPAALMGIDIQGMVARALRMQNASASCVPTSLNPALKLGAALGELAKSGRNKLTLLLPDSISSFGLWLEQLLAESTGKEGTGILPVADEPPGKLSEYGDDRVFVYFQMKKAPSKALEKFAASLKSSGHPMITIQMDDLLDLGQEFFRWELATAAIGAVLGINPFDQPNVQESKDNTKRMLSMVRGRGELPEATIPVSAGLLKFYQMDAAPSGGEEMENFLDAAKPGDYLAIMAYLPEDSSNYKLLQAFREAIRSRLHVATTLGYGPRYLHSTGQFHKGGPPTGLFLQLTADDPEDMAVPGAPYTFGILKRAQAQGDLQALRSHKRRVIRIHLGGNAVEGLKSLKKMVGSK